MPRNTDYKTEYCQQAIEYLKNGGSKLTLGTVFNVTYKTIKNWANENTEFTEAIDMGMSQQLRLLEELRAKNTTDKKNSGEHDEVDPHWFKGHMSSCTRHMANLAAEKIDVSDEKKAIAQLNQMRVDGEIMCNSKDFKGIIESLEKSHNVKTTTIAEQLKEIIDQITKEREG